MRWNTFGRSATFAALAAAAVMPWLLVAAPPLGVGMALRFYLVAVTAAYVTVIAPSLRRGLAAGALLGGLGTVLVAVVHGLPGLAIGLGILLALERSAILYQSPPARAVAIEVAVVTSGLLFARCLAGTSLVSVMTALWGFLLVQSVFFLVGGIHARGSCSADRDPFDAAYERASALLDGVPFR